MNYLLFFGLLEQVPELISLCNVFPINSKNLWEKKKIPKVVRFCILIMFILCIIHREKPILNLVNSNQSRILITLHRFIQHQTEVRFVRNVSKICNAVLVWFELTRFVCVYVRICSQCIPNLIRQFSISDIFFLL